VVGNRLVFVVVTIGSWFLCWGFAVTKILKEFEFDVHPATVAKVQLRRAANADAVVVVCGEFEAIVLASDRDQWGVWHTLNGLTVPQEDCTRSMIDGIIKCLEELRKMTEYQTKPADPVGA
jgi:hypothetical protein